MNYPKARNNIFRGKNEYSRSTEQYFPGKNEYFRSTEQYFLGKNEYFRSTKELSLGIKELFRRGKLLLRGIKQLFRGVNELFQSGNELFPGEVELSRSGNLVFSSVPMPGIAVGFSQRVTDANSAGLQPHFMWVKPVSLFSISFRRLKPTACPDFSGAIEKREFQQFFKYTAQRSSTPPAGGGRGLGNLSGQQGIRASC